MNPKFIYDIGSSPRLWGTRDRFFERLYLYRFIPTPVGNTFVGTESGQLSAVHPHACGEHVPAPSVSALDIGSSPRLWGTHVPVQFQLQSIRFIPTPVGNTRRNSNETSYWPVHPHACGEHRVFVKERSNGIGSSPRLWGTRRAIPSL